MVIIGGRQSLAGCVVDALALALIRELLVDHPTYAQGGQLWCDVDGGSHARLVLKLA